mmetsp:Transcript_25546/g.43082  ORF Transcript_25546/g.43082 Transcript_25546/m.43082 type:complete len:224 (-) Transcript_25546:72-743(-)
MLQNLEATLYTVTQGSIYDLSDKRQILQLSLIVQSLFVFCFSITAFLVSSTANAGFNVVLNAFLNVGFVGGSFYAVKAKAPIAIGFLIGVTMMMAMLDLMTAIYWGNLSHCTKITDEVLEQYSCQNRTTYQAVCVFASILCILKTVFVVALVKWHQLLIDETGVYGNISQDSTGRGDLGVKGFGVGVGEGNSEGNYSLNDSSHQQCFDNENDDPDKDIESFSI